MDLNKLNSLKDILINFYSDEGEERVGFIKGDNTIVETPNISSTPTEGFSVSGAEIIRNIEENGCWATWHTHPGVNSNLSGEDYLSFKNWADLYHFIIGNNGVSIYKWDNEKDALILVD
jgi:proteasome lid subunit RPN8/RPN11